MVGQSTGPTYKLASPGIQIQNCEVKPWPPICSAARANLSLGNLGSKSTTLSVSRWRCGPWRLPQQAGHRRVHTTVFSRAAAARDGAWLLASRGPLCGKLANITLPIYPGLWLGKRLEAAKSQQKKALAHGEYGPNKSSSMPSPSLMSSVSPPSAKACCHKGTKGSIADVRAGCRSGRGGTARKPGGTAKRPGGTARRPGGTARRHPVLLPPAMLRLPQAALLPLARGLLMPENLLEELGPVGQLEQPVRPLPGRGLPQLLQFPPHAALTGLLPAIMRRVDVQHLEPIHPDRGQVPAGGPDGGGLVGAVPNRECRRCCRRRRRREGTRCCWRRA